MKPEYINLARDAIAGRASGRDERYYWSGDPDRGTGFKEAINNEYVIRSLDPHCGWEAALNENVRLLKENDALLRQRDAAEATALHLRTELTNAMERMEEARKDRDGERDEHDEIVRSLKAQVVRLQAKIDDMGTSI